jgi:hypothetical protein
VHAVVQLPQCEKSDFVSTHEVSHACRPEPHAHTPDTQVCRAEHAWPQVPQFWESVCKLRQAAPQGESPVVHWDEEPPAASSLALDESLHPPQMIARRTPEADTIARFIAATSVRVFPAPNVDNRGAVIARIWFEGPNVSKDNPGWLCPGTVLVESTTGSMALPRSATCHRAAQAKHGRARYQDLSQAQSVHLSMLHLSASALPQTTVRDGSRNDCMDDCPMGSRNRYLHGSYLPMKSCAVSILVHA